MRLSARLSGASRRGFAVVGAALLLGGCPDGADSSDDAATSGADAEDVAQGTDGGDGDVRVGDVGADGVSVEDTSEDAVELPDVIDTVQEDSASRDVEAPLDVSEPEDIGVIADTDDGLDAVGPSDTTDTTDMADATDTTDGDVVDPVEPPAPPEELTFVHIEGATQGVFAPWDNPWEVLADVEPGAYGWVDDHTFGVLGGTGSTGSGTATGRRQHQPFTVRTRWSPAVVQTLNALTKQEFLTIDVLTLQRQSNGEYTQRRIETLTNAWASGVRMDAANDDGALQTSGSLSFVYQGIGVTDFETNTSYTDSLGGL